MRVLVFDSGIGGLGIAREIRALMPDAAVTYLMDDAWFPYGGRDEGALVARVLAVVGAGIARLAPDLTVVACNTASTSALAAVRVAFEVAFVGCVPPVKAAAAASRTRVIGVLATPATVRGPYLRGLAERHAGDCRVLIHGAAGLARLAEARFAGAAVPGSAVRTELAGLMDQVGSGEMDAVALGCTHYGWLLEDLRAAMWPQVSWHDPAAPVARQVARVACTLTGARAGEDGLVLRTGVDLAMGQGWEACGFRRAERLEMGGFESKTLFHSAWPRTMVKAEGQENGPRR